ncbi:hypothetical protein IWQ47_003142 [Aquimarina sp. EL_43]|uniref:hypothetical protein n=1 Tax=unclassified Aquimarina TaxID=2627091 RepID=UPI0018C9BD7C|nr:MULTISPECIES: hypothetical protein [unclassified Aquimarina]MBG6131539.1 hypothetical protein [Aquimarina sp. EL_35]MBG6151999.1 hypothetical protein [Aquimarina sp. EL_32]MBG6170057.1 hypothetical protein [Aquimarina sp. EL_43]
MEFLFEITYDFLKFLEKLTGFSYKEINIIIWFFLIPFTWMFLLDKITEKNYFKIGFFAIVLIILITIPDFENFANWSFNSSVDFLNLFNNIGSNYKTSSVVICLLIPLLIYGLLIRKAYFKKR